MFVWRIDQILACPYKADLFAVFTMHDKTWDYFGLLCKGLNLGCRPFKIQFIAPGIGNTSRMVSESLAMR